jgi:hypothetical protein
MTGDIRFFLAELCFAPLSLSPERLLWCGVGGRDFFFPDADKRRTWKILAAIY